MATRRGKSQARRNSGPNGLPGWAWLVMGVILTVAVVLLAPKWLKSDGDGIWRPQPNPDARPVPLAEGADEIADGAADQAGAIPAGGEASAGTEYDFYTLLPGKEVALSDSELAATERAEERRAAQREAQLARSILEDKPLPPPVEGEPLASTGAAASPAEPSAPAAPVPSVAATPADGTRYLLQAGAFQSASQAEELKARIALLGLGARVESARIDGKPIHRVRMGPYASASELADAKRKLASGGLPALAIKVQ